MAISTKKGDHKEQPKPCSLQAGRRLILTNPNHNWPTTIFAEQGIIRLSTVENENHPEITLALMSSLDDCKFYHPNSENLQIEAITDSIVKISNEQKALTSNDDFIQEWIFRLYTVRHPIKSEDRLKSLLQLLIIRLGKRTPEGYKLQFLLSHSRLAEIIGTTRSTVSRSLGALKEKGIISIDEMKEELVVKDSELVTTTATRVTLPL